MADNGRFNYYFLEISFGVLKLLKEHADKNIDFNKISDKLFVCVNRLKKQIEIRLRKNEELDRVLKMIDLILISLDWIGNIKSNYIKYMIEDFCEIINDKERQMSYYCNNLDLDDLITNINEDNLNEIENIKKMILNYSLYLTPIANKLNSFYKSKYEKVEMTSKTTDAIDEKVEITTKTTDAIDEKLTNFLKRKIEKKLEQLQLEIVEKMKSSNYEIDIRLVSKIDCFIEKFPLSALEIQTVQIIELLKNYLNKQVDVTQIEKDFNSIIKSKHETKQDMIKKARQLNNLFTELEKIKVLKYLPGSINEIGSCSKFLERFKDKLTGKINMNIKETNRVITSLINVQTIDLDANINVIKEFKRFLNNDELSNKHDNCLEKLDEMKYKIINETYTSLKSNEPLNTIDINHNLNRLNRQSSTDSANIDLIKLKLNEYIKKKCNDIMNEANGLLPQSEVEPLYVKYQNIQNVKTDLSDLVSDDTINDISKMEEEVKLVFTNYMNFKVNDIIVLLQKFDPKAEEKLVYYCDATKQSYLKIMGVKTDILDKLNETNRSIKDIVMKNIENYINEMKIRKLRFVFK
jgi:hypothetical protein